MIELLVLAVALAMDATAAAASVAARARTLRPVLASAALFGLFQAGMAGAGWWGGEAVVRWAEAWDHWLAFALLAGLGVRAIREGLHPDGEGTGPEPGVAALLALSVATSVMRSRPA